MRRRFSREGLTIFETVIAIGLLVLLLGISLPIGFDAYQSYLLTSELRNMLSIIRRAESLALSNSFGSNYGISVQPDKYVIFQGPSYATRNPNFDEEYLFHPGISVSSTPEIVWSPIAATTTPTTITLFNDSKSVSLDINSQGVIDW